MPTGASIPATVTSKQTTPAPGSGATVAVPEPSGSPAAGASDAPDNCAPRATAPFRSLAAAVVVVVEPADTAGSGSSDPQAAVAASPVMASTATRPRIVVTSLVRTNGARWFTAAPGRPATPRYRGSVARPTATHAYVADGAVAETFEAVVANVARVVQGKDDAIRLAVCCMLAEGHLLIEDVPGVGKTTLAKALGASVGCSWHRIQFTPDLLPSDVTGVTVYSRSTGAFEFRPGGIFANIVLGDEINRASPKTQSALLEAMQERQVTVDTTTYALPEPFMVIATQNPVEHEGTYPLPESQLDRFLMRISMGYPDRVSEIEMLHSHGDRRAGAPDDLSPVVRAADVAAMADAVRLVHVAPAIEEYLVDLADATRRHPSLALGVSPRATLALQGAARARAAATGRGYVVPDDVKALAGPVIEHRLVLTPEAAIAGVGPGEVLHQVLAGVPIPSGRPAGRAQ